MIIEYRTGQLTPIIIGRDNRKRRDWECTLTCRYNHGDIVIEFSAQRLLATEMQPVIAAESAKVFAEYGEPLFVKFKGVTR